MSKNLRLTTNVKLNTQTNISDKDRKKLSSNNLNSKIYNNIYLSPNKNLNYQQDEERNNYRSNNNYNSIHTEESKNEVRSNSYNKMKPISPLLNGQKKPNVITKSSTTTNVKDGMKKRILSPNSTSQPKSTANYDRIVTEPNYINPLSSKTPNFNNNSNRVNTQTNSNEYTTVSKNVETINVADLLGAQNNVPISINNLNVHFPNYESPKCSVKSLTTVKAYSANTNQGIIRTYNEDRVSIILNIVRPTSFKGDVWPRCSFFGVFDGHGGSNCADFLRDNLHHYIIKDPNFPVNPTEALKNGFEAAEKDFLYNHALTEDGNEVADRSGSCAVIAILIDEMCYIANVGDSRALLSTDLGKNFTVLTNDHKPNEEGETKRIVENGGKVYQTQTPAKNLNLPFLQKNSNQVLVGPYRVFPGRLSVSRTFGDVEAKIVKLGGLPGVITATPEITSFKIKDDCDFLMLGCDGIFDQMNNNEIIEGAWMTTAEGVKAKNIHLQCGLAVDMIIKSSLVKRTFDNVTVVLVAFKNFETIFEEEKGETKKPYLSTHNNSSSHQLKTLESTHSDNNLLQNQRTNHSNYNNHTEKPKSSGIITNNSNSNNNTNNNTNTNITGNSNISSVNSIKGHAPSLSTNISSLNYISSGNNTNYNNNYKNNNMNTEQNSKSNQSSQNNLHNLNSQYTTNNYLRTDSNTSNLQDKIQTMIDKKPKIRNLSEIIDKNNYFSNNKVLTTTNKNSASGSRYKKSEENVLQYFTKPERKYDVQNKQGSNNLNTETNISSNNTRDRDRDRDSRDNNNNTSNNNRDEMNYYRANTEASASDYKDISRSGKGSSLTKILNNKPMLKSGLMVSNSTSTVQKTASMNSKNFNMILGGNMGVGLNLTKPSNNSSIKLKTMDIKKKKYDVVDSFESLGANKKKTEKLDDKKIMTDFLSNLPSTTKNTNILKTKENTFENLKKSIQQPIKSYSYKR